MLNIEQQSNRNFFLGRKFVVQLIAVIETTNRAEQKGKRRNQRKKKKKYTKKKQRNLKA